MIGMATIKVITMIAKTMIDSKNNDDIKAAIIVIKTMITKYKNDS